MRRLLVPLFIFGMAFHVVAIYVGLAFSGYADELSDKARKLRDAVQRCNTRPSCDGRISVGFKGGTIITMSQAETMAKSYKRIVERVQDGDPERLYDLQKAIDDATAEKCTQRACNFFVISVTAVQISRG